MTPELKNKIKESFRDRTLNIKSYDKKSNAVSWFPVDDVMRHSSIGKKIMKVITSIGSSIFTEDHSLFSSKDKTDVRTSDINIGDGIIGTYNDKIVEAKVLSVVSEEPREYTYDVSVPGSESFFLGSGILAHNSYSISGVSLDLEKSSKYQSMKDEYIQEADKVFEAAKETIKIVKGLRQARYGIGITSALGPYSRAGVQSRRNYVGASRPMWV